MYDLEDYINTKLEFDENKRSRQDEMQDFFALCQEIKSCFYNEWESRENSRSELEIQKRAIIGYKKEKLFFMNRITDLIKGMSAERTVFPSWYNSLEEAVYHEIWGLAGISEWFGEDYKGSSSAKIIGEKIFFMEHGHMVLKPQTISVERKEQLIKSFLLLTPEERMDKSYYELYLLDGTRVTIFTEPMAKKGQSCIVFRRYLIPSLTFEEQAFRGTIPFNMIPLLKAMVAVGFNVVFLGAVRTAKTTFLSTWQGYENPALEGVMVETDPEIPLHRILPNAPILQLIADGDSLASISKNLLRSDADYFVLAEARDGIALDTAVKIASKGTKRMKLTFHSRRPNAFPLEAATEIVKQTGGDLHLTMQMVASSFDFLFHFVQLEDKSQKRLKGIYQMSCSDDGKIDIHPICEYRQDRDDWIVFDNITDEAASYGRESNAEAFNAMMTEIKKLSEMSEIR